MSTTTALPDTLDVSQTPAVPLSRLIRVELRKMYDTRAGLWLLAIIGIVTTLAIVLFGVFAKDADKTFSNFSGFAATPQGFLLPVMAILLITQEWGQRTAMVTFTLEPHRSRILTAKVAAALVIGLGAYVLAMVVALLSALVLGGSGAFDDFSSLDLGTFGMLQILGILQGLGFGLVLLNSAAAIVLYFALPTIFGIIGGIWPAFADKAAWFDLGTAQTPLFDGAESLTGQEWTQLGVTAVIWVGIPLAVGTWRMLRAELK
ncbi:ABC transporter permease [Nocardioides marmoriginsengisoli]|uniref:ABC transporter permease n=1 Tax=Nocardioides marmoriginsengisoli TaxID=661483 RepID=A0A3N0CI47_9ACTN|nr:ABC transporter permease [Nocardioides marmoriginsengisoli]RNL63148.1 ABC transporter permease [Nocardioides marmoriginsengisoli]